ncbi:MAG: DUF882 domain-containing protein [Chromatiaceae bacterium]|nr:DUF882 domain-containing protein [Gammaproteobacteria bacterium]MCP5448320.1 DUF882 domain-containing protein [Chromatiaceae bacterium]MCB1863443.1 DUF882 domain-containing protein [Gammaproteobacteria bacterium]MCB1870991.1 DUF882 domain-containing protein [Gammaproteobacteria bacterium]MCB1880080.1 DUF882 domain-containing protein [Gammaproteobacteria bacterium]
MNPTRRLMLKSAILAPFLPLPQIATAAIAGERKLSFYHTHTGEKLSVVYHDGSEYLAESLSDIDSCLRDFRTGDIKTIDPQLLDQLFALKRMTGSNGVYEVISAYRSPQTNLKLRNRSSGVAKKSLHMLGRAIDVRLTDVDCGRLRKAALALQSGGVGLYRKSDFVHLDTGPHRTW